MGSESDNPALPAEAGALSPRSRRRHGVVAVVERDAAAVCELSLGSGVRIGRAALQRNGENGIDWNVDDPTVVAALLASLLERAGLPPRLDALALPQSLFGVTCTVVPPVQGEALAAVLARRLREAMTDATGEWLVDTTPIGNPGDEQATVVPSVLAWTDRAALERLDSALKSHRVALRRVVPPMVGLLNLLGHARAAGTKDALLVVHASLPSLCIILFDGEDLLYVRPLRDVLAAAPESLPEVVLTEVQRTVAYFRENQGGRGVGQVLVSGLAEGTAGRFCRWLETSTGTPCAPLALAATAPSPATANVAVDRDALSALLPTLAGILLPTVRLHVAAPRAMNLLQRPPRQLGRTFAVASVAVALVALVAWARVRWSYDAAEKQNRRDTLAAEVATLQSGENRRGQVLAAARRSGEEKRALELIGATGANPVQPLLESTMLVPAGLDIAGSKLTRPRANELAAPIAPLDARIELRLRGDFTSPAIDLVDPFLRALEVRPWCASATADVTQGTAANGARGEEVRVEVTLR